MSKVIDNIPKSYKEENMWFKLLSGDMIELSTDNEKYEVQLGRILNVSTLSVGLEKDEKEDMYYVIMIDLERILISVNSEVKTDKVDDIVKKDMLSYLFRCLVNT